MDAYNDMPRVMSRLLTSRIPAIRLASTVDHYFDLSQLPERSLLICYPFAVVPDKTLQLPYSANRIHGDCSRLLQGFSLHQRNFEKYGIALFGVSTQSLIIQKIVSDKLGITFPLLSDARRYFANALGLPMTMGGRISRMQPIGLVVVDGNIKQVFYPLTPNTSCSEEILDALAIARED